MCGLGSSSWPRGNTQYLAVPSPEAGTMGRAGDGGWDIGQPTGPRGQSSPQGLMGSTILDSDVGPILSAPTTHCAKHPNHSVFP